MRADTIAVHGGFGKDPATRAVAVPIYQTVAYEFESADEAAALFDLEIDGFRYSRISNPTSAVLERRVAELEGGVGALCVASGQAALYYAFANVADHGGNIVAAPTLYGTTHTLLQHVLPRQGIDVRFAAAARPRTSTPRSTTTTRAVFCESVGNPAGNICDIEALAKIAHEHRRSAHRRQHGGDADPAAPDRAWRRHRRALADEIHGRPWHDDGRRHRRRRALSLERITPRAFPMFNEPDAPITASSTPSISARRAFIASAPQRLSAHDGRGARALQRLPAAARHRDAWRCASSAMSRMRARSPSFCATTQRVDWVNYAGFRGQPLSCAGAKISRRPRASLLTFGVKGGLQAGKALLRCAAARQARSSISATRNRSPAIRPRRRIARCRPKNS